ncbi:hypothetical protein FAZ78_22125 [Cereibacter changlensis]|uniref:HNH endonuclease n=1 Tax=Cereibacter changlensis TaxID=402884 RepID=A0A4U0YSH6_9RHOB|nr:hypothetical protein [Cereibacter changlensis]TKA94478.1 hypothetical protein FAZ78_22125 [Cereibacter changlensis]
MMPEKAKRLAPKGDTLRELFLKSGNLCAFPGCGQLMMDAEGTFIGQVCHIEAVEEDGERFNSTMTNEDRRAASNLMLMCYQHHQKTNDAKAYPVEKLKQMKDDHERRFSRPDRAILETLTDWTELDAPTEARNLMRLDKVLGWNSDATELKEAAEELNVYVAQLRSVPIELRKFVGAVMKRAVKMEHSRVVKTGMAGTLILISDLKGAFNLEERAIAERANQLDAYGLGDIDQIDTDMGPKPAVRIRDLKSGWPLWRDIVTFCEQAEEPLEAFTEDLDFARLDD